MNVAWIITGLWFSTMVYWCFLYGYQRVDEALIGVAVFLCFPVPQMALDLGMAVQFLILILLAEIIWISNRLYHWRFPVFDGSPYKVVQDKSGDDIHLYIRLWKGVYRIGIDYPIVGEDYSGRGRTRYTDRFHSLVQAESQLLKRSEEFM